jgi:DNA-directed RNA polymerase specialized sigma subunit
LRSLLPPFARPEGRERTIKLAQELWRTSTEVEIAEESQMDVAEYHGFLGKYSSTHVAPHEARMQPKGGSEIEYGALVADSSAADPEPRATLQNLHAQLADAMDPLEEREKLITTFYF